MHMTFTVLRTETEWKQSQDVGHVKKEATVFTSALDARNQKTETVGLCA